MIFVGARLGYDVDDRASREAILGIVFAGIYLHFLDAFYGWHHSHICVLRLTVEDSLDVHSVRVGIYAADRGQLGPRQSDCRTVFSAVAPVVAAAGAVVCAWQ